MPVALACPATGAACLDAINTYLVGKKMFRPFLGPSVSSLGLWLTPVPGTQYSSALVQGQALDDPHQDSSPSALLTF